MAKIDKGILKDWNDGDTVFEVDYEKDREIIRVAINDNYDRLVQKYDKTEVDTLLNAVKGEGWDQSINLKGLNGLVSSILSDGWVTTNRIGNQQVTREKVKDGAIGLTQLDPDITKQPITEIGQQAKFAEIDANLAQSEKELFNSKYKHKPKTLRPLVAFTFDDGTIYDLDTLTLFNQKGIVGTTGIILDAIGTTNYMTVDQIKQMQDAGWEIASHSKTHQGTNFTTLTDAVLETELKDSKEGLKALGFDVKNFIIPYGFTEDRIAKIAAKYYRSMRVSGAGNLDQYNKTPISTFRINSVQCADTDGITNPDDNLTYWKSVVDNAVANPCLVVFVTHSNNLVQKYNRLTEMGELIDYIKSINVDIVTLDQALDIYENQVDTDKMKIGADGKVSGQYGKMQYASNDAILNGTPLAEIEYQQTTINVITAGNSEGFVHASGGTITTVKPDNIPERAFQIGKGYGKNQPLQYRDFDGTGASSWRILENIFVHPNDSLDSSHTTSALRVNVINQCYITQNGGKVSGYPLGLAGLLTGYFFVHSGHVYEDYKLLNSRRIFRRVWDSSSASWSTWQELHETTTLALDSLNASSAITSFPYGLTYLQITSGNSTGMPSAAAWLLETRRTHGNGFNTQYAHIYDGTATYKRVWLSTNAWSAWSQVST